MAHDITFLPEIRWNMDRFTVDYHAERASDLILCRISWEALQDGWPQNQKTSPEETFKAHRAQIEEIARDLISRGRFESDGTIGIKSVDVRHLEL